MSEDSSRAELVNLSREALERRLSNATAGNMSVRIPGGMLITPSGMPPRDMTPAHIVRMTLDGAAEGDWKPSSEWALHAEIYRSRPEVGGIVHAHPVHCTALSALRCPIPAFHYMVGGLGGDEVPCSPYETFGTLELAMAVTQAVGKQYHGCLMANHGMIAFGKDLKSAFHRTELLEVLAEQYLLAMSSGQKITLLTSTEMEAVRQNSKRLNYGSPRREGDK